MERWLRVLLKLTTWGAILHIAESEPAQICGQNVSRKLIADKNNCSVYYVCSHGELEEKSCGPNQSFYKHMCFEKYSKHDLCNRPIATPFRPRSLKSHAFRTGCLHGETGVFPHPFRCAQYFNCSDFPMDSGIVKRPFLHECPVSQLFDARTGSCRDAAVVNCGTQRTRPTDQCDYMKNQCLSSHAIPCGIVMPSCKGLPDGVNAWPDRTGTPLYITCDQGELISKNKCDVFTDNAGVVTQPMFDQFSRRCVVSSS